MKLGEFVTRINEKVTIASGRRNVNVNVFFDAEFDSKFLTAVGIYACVDAVSNRTIYPKLNIQANIPQLGIALGGDFHKSPISLLPVQGRLQNNATYISLYLSLPDLTISDIEFYVSVFLYTNDKPVVKYCNRITQKSHLSNVKKSKDGIKKYSISILSAVRNF